MAQNSSTNPDTSGNNTITGATWADQLSDGGGNDTIIGLDGNDRLSGDAPTQYSGIKNVRLDFWLAMVAAVTAILMAGAGIYQTALLRNVRIDAFASNLQTLRIQACSKALAIFGNSLSLQQQGVFLLREDTGLTDLVRAKLAQSLGERFGTDQQQNLRSAMIELSLLYPNSSDLAEMQREYGVFSFSFGQHMTLLSISYSEEPNLPSDGWDYDQVVQANVDAKIILSVDGMEDALVSLSEKLVSLNSFCIDSAQSDDL